MSAFTIDQICKQAGVSRGLINHHFKTKEDLLICIYADMTDHLVRDFNNDEPRQQLAEIIETSFDEQSFKPSNLRAWLSIWGEVATNEVLNSLHQSRYRKYKARIAQALNEYCRNRQNGTGCRQCRQAINCVNRWSLARVLFTLDRILAGCRESGLLPFSAKPRGNLYSNHKSHCECSEAINNHVELDLNWFGPSSRYI